MTVVATTIHGTIIITVTVSGESVSHITDSAAATAGIRLNTNGTLSKREGDIYILIDTATDWLKPAGFADSTYEARIVNVNWTSTSTGFLVEAAAEDVWINMAANREWSTRDNSPGGTGQKLVSFDLEIRKGSSGGALDSGSYTLEAEYEIPA